VLREPLKAAAAFRSAKACLGHPGGGSRRALAPSSPTSLAELVRSEMNPIPLADESRLVALVNDFTTTSRRWHKRAACSNLPPGVDAYFPDGGESPSADALDLCLTCPVATECLASALIHESQSGYRFGWWGGVGPDGREQLAQRLGIQTIPVELDIR